MINILVYSGKGTFHTSICNLTIMIQELVINSNVQHVTHIDLINNSFMNDTDLLVMPGGVASHYMSLLSGKGNNNIKQYVAGGGKYLGVCAGAYYAAKKVEFSTSDPDLNVIAERELCFYPGISSGPKYSDFSYDTNGVRIAEILLNDPCKKKSLNCFYHGGGSFDAAEKFPNVKVLARYSLDQSPAIVECKVAKGLAVLCGPHIEWDPFIPYKDDKMKNIQESLQIDTENRLMLFSNILTKLGLPTESSNAISRDKQKKTKMAYL